MVTSPSTPTAAHEDVGADEVGGRGRVRICLSRCSCQDNVKNSKQVGQFGGTVSRTRANVEINL